MPGRITSEAELIATYLAPLTAGFPGAFNLSDDCAALPVAEGLELIVTTDAVAASVHCFADDAAGDIAWKALAVNVSDLVAKGAEPYAYTMALSFPEPPERVWMEAFAAGLSAAQTAFGLTLAGGDSDVRPGPLSVTITAFGILPKGGMVRRSGATAGDVIFVTGTIGDSGLGLALRKVPAQAQRWQLPAADHERLVQRYLRPEPRAALIPAIRKFATASIDVSDGLAKDLGHLCRASDVGASVELDRCPRSQAAQRVVALEPGIQRRLITSGDDYEVLLTVPQNAAAEFEAAAKAARVVVTAIGTIDADRDVRFLASDGASVQLGRLGWEHF